MQNNKECYINDTSLDIDDQKDFIGSRECITSYDLFQEHKHVNNGNYNNDKCTDNSGDGGSLNVRRSGGENDDSGGSSGSPSDVRRNDDDSGSDSDDNSETKRNGYYPVKIGDCYHNRYIIEKKIGSGYFSTVWAASDITADFNDPNKIVAIKISKNKESFQEAARDERKFLIELQNIPFIVSLLDQFVLSTSCGNHYCLVFEMMWKDLYIMLYNGYITLYGGDIT